MSSRKAREQASQLDPYLPYLFERWAEGCHTIAGLFRELVERGYQGSYGSVYDNLVRLLPTGRKQAVDSSSKAPTLATSRQAAFLFLRRPEKLRVEEQETVAKLRQINRSASIEPMTWCSSLPSCCALAPESTLTPGLSRWKAANCPNSSPRLAGVKKDKDAVRAGLTWWGSQRDGGGTRDEAETDQKTRIWSGRLSTPRANASFMRCSKEQVHLQSRTNRLLKDHQPGSVFVSKIAGDLSGKHWELSLPVSCPTQQRGPTDLHVA